MEPTEPRREIQEEVDRDVGWSGMSRGRQVAIVAAAGMAIAVVILGAILLVRSLSDDEPPSRPGFGVGSPTSTPSPTPSPTEPSPTASATTTATASPPGSSPSPTGGSGSGSTVVTAAGAILQQVSNPPINPAPQQAACHALADPGWVPECSSVNMAGGTAVWMVQHRPAGTCCEARVVRVFTYSPEAGGWIVHLEGRDLQGQGWSDVKVRALDLTGDGRIELVFGFRFQGSGNILGYDIMTFPAGSGPQVAAHPDEASHGSVTLGGGRVDEYSAQYPNNEPNCCPPYFLHRVIQWDGSVFRATNIGNVDPIDVPPSDL